MNPNRKREIVGVIRDVRQLKKLEQILCNTALLIDGGTYTEVFRDDVERSTEKKIAELRKIPHDELLGALIS